MQITLRQFEQIDGLMASLLRAGPFETYAEPREYIRISNRLLDACIDATRYAYVDDFADALDCASHIVTLAMLDQIEVVDEETL